MLGFAGRDLSTRAAPKVLSNVQLGVYGFLVLIPTGLVMLWYSGGAVWPDVTSALQIVRQQYSVCLYLPSGLIL